jgi:hypothetical protein
MQGAGSGQVESGVAPSYQEATILVKDGVCTPDTVLVDPAGSVGSYLSWRHRPLHPSDAARDPADWVTPGRQGGRNYGLDRGADADGVAARRA